MKIRLAPSSTVLFQGDSITDCGRSRETQAPNVALGNGYAHLVSARLLADRPADGLRFFNRGISGNRILDLAARIKADVLNLKPDVLSVLVGVNDTWHEFNYRNGVAVPKYEALYRAFLAEVKKELPAIRFVLCEPFVLPCGVVTQDWVAEMDARRVVVKKLAAEFDAVFVPFQDLFDRSAKEAPAAFWAEDGVHPSPAGHQRMADLWIRSATT